MGIIFPLSGDVPKWLKGPHSKCGRVLIAPREFKSLHLRQKEQGCPTGIPVLFRRYAADAGLEKVALRPFPGFCTHTHCQLAPTRCKTSSNPLSHRLGAKPEFKSPLAQTGQFLLSIPHTKKPPHRGGFSFYNNFFKFCALIAAHSIRVRPPFGWSCSTISHSVPTSRAAFNKPETS